MDNERIEHIVITGMSERELEDYLARHPSQIRDGLTLLGRQFPTDSGSLDLLLSDSDGIVWVTELKVQADDGQLTQGLRYYDYVKTNIETIARRFGTEGHDVDATKEPGLILISTEFSPTLTRAARYVSIPIELVEAIPVLLPSDRKEAICRSVDCGTPYYPPVIPTRELNLAYIRDDIVQKLCRGILESLENRGAEIRPLKGFWFAVRKDGLLFLWIGCKKQFLSVYVAIDDDRWSRRIRVETQDDWEQKIEFHLSWLDDE